MDPEIANKIIPDITNAYIISNDYWDSYDINRKYTIEHDITDLIKSLYKKHCNVEEGTIDAKLIEDYITTFGEKNTCIGKPLMVLYNKTNSKNRQDFFAQQINSLDDKICLNRYAYEIHLKMV